MHCELIGRELMKLPFKSALFIACLAAFGAHAESPISGTVGVQLVLEAGCAIYDGDGGDFGGSFGTLDFGTKSAAFRGTLDAQVAGMGTTQIVCDPGTTSISLTVDGGENPGLGSDIGAGTRAMKFGEGSYVPYDVYTSDAYSETYPANGSAVSYTIPNPGQPFTLPIYGRVNKTSPAALAAGTYQDTLTVTVSW